MIARHPILTVTILAGALSWALSCDKGPRGGEAARPTEPTGGEAATEQAEAKPAATGEKSYGAGVQLGESTPIAEILNDPASYADKAVRVEGMVTDVCTKRGCWFEIGGDAPGQKMRFKVQDGVMVFPVEAKGKYAIAEGVVKVEELDLEQTRARAAHEAEERGEELDPATVTEPVVAVRLDGTGALIRDQK